MFAALPAGEPTVPKTNNVPSLRPSELERSTRQDCLESLLSSHRLPQTFFDQKSRNPHNPHHELQLLPDGSPDHSDDD